MTDLVGQNLGPYRITEPLGAGGMATVYKAYQPSMDRYVAVKVLPRHFASDPTFTGRFEQEAKVIANLEHARILPVYDYGEHDGITYIVMRYLDAGTLSDHLKMREMPLDEIARILLQVAEGLDYAHSKGVIHRDIKPANIMLAESGNVYVTDFGISKLMEGTAQFTGSGIVGTPTYVSPEQGLGLKIDHRTDIYSLGVVLYQMATGSVPYKAETPMAVVIKHIHEPLPMPRSVNPDLPESIERVILRAMAKEPDARYASCGEMTQALLDAVAESKGESVPAHERTTEISTPTTPGVFVSPDTLPVPVAPDDDASTLPAVSLPADDLGTVPAALIPEEEPARRGWILPVAIVGGLIVVGLIIGAVLLITGGALGTVADTTPIGEVTAVPDTGEVEVIPPEDGGVPGMLGCKDGQETILAADFSDPGAVPFELLPGSEIARLDNGKNVLMMRAVGVPAVLPIPIEMADSTFHVELSLPEGEAIFKLHTRHNPEAGMSYATVYTPDQAIQLERWFNGEMVIVADPVPIMSLVGDGQSHRLAFRVGGEGREFAMLIGGNPVVEWHEMGEPLPPGIFMIELLEGTIAVSGIAICAGEGPPPPEGGEKPLPPEGVGEPIFKDDFNLMALGPDWHWGNEPEGQWALTEGQLMMPVLPLTGVSKDAETPSKSVPLLILDMDALLGSRRPDSFTVQVDVNVHPTQNFQAAGLVVVSEKRVPILSLMRGYCDRAEYCEGDALHFDHWMQYLQIVQEGGFYRPFVARLENPEVVTLRLVYKNQENLVIAAYSLDGGATWEPVGEWALFAEGRLGYIGLMTSSGGQEVDSIPAFFDNFVILPGG